MPVWAQKSSCCSRFNFITCLSCLSAPSMNTQSGKLLEYYLDKGSAWENVKTYRPITGSCNHNTQTYTQNAGNLFFFLFDAGIQRPESEEDGGETWIGCEAMSLQDLRSYPGLFGQSRWIDALPMSIPVPNLATKAELREGAQISLHITLTGQVTGFCASHLSLVTKG